MKLRELIADERFQVGIVIISRAVSPSLPEWLDFFS